MLTFLKNNVSIILKKEINKGDEPNEKENSKNKNRIKKIEVAGFKSKFVEFEQTVKQT